MRKLIIIAALAASLGGCATIQPKIDNALHRHRMPVKAQPAHVQAAPPPVIVAPPPPPAPEKPKGFFDRHPIKWIH